MSANNTGGFALPSSASDYDPEFGMTLRDYFAAKAMQSLMLTEPLDLGDESRGCQIDQTDGITYEAYRMADAMLETRRTYKRKN